MAKRRTQRTAVLEYLQEKKTITSMQAIQTFGITRLSAVIFDLRKAGYIIESNMIKVPTRWGSELVAEYTYVGKEDL